MLTGTQAGRFAVASQLGGRKPLSASATNAAKGNRFTPNGLAPNETAEEMTSNDISVTVAEFVHAAKCAIEAGFDGVEIVTLLTGTPDSWLIN